MKAAFVGKDRVAGSEVAHLEALGMAVALAGGDLVTTPSGGGADAVARGFQATAGRSAIFERVPPNTDADPVLFYADGELHRKLIEKDPSPIDARWVLMTDLEQLERFIAGAFTALADRGIAVA